MLRANSVAVDTPFPEISDEFLSSPNWKQPVIPGKVLLREEISRNLKRYDDKRVKNVSSVAHTYEIYMIYLISLSNPTLKSAKTS